MHRQRATGGDYQKRRETTWAALGYGYFAPGRVAMDEQRARAMTEAAHSRLLASPESAGGRWSPRQSSPLLLGHLLFVIRARCRRMHAYGATIAAWRKSAAG